MQVYTIEAIVEINNQTKQYPQTTINASLNKYEGWLL